MVEKKQPSLLEFQKGVPRRGDLRSLSVREALT
jgi:hypothetical protein